MLQCDRVQVRHRRRARALRALCGLLHRRRRVPRLQVACGVHWGGHRRPPPIQICLVPQQRMWQLCHASVSWVASAQLSLSLWCRHRCWFPLECPGAILHQVLLLLSCSLLTALTLPGHPARCSFAGALCSLCSPCAHCAAPAGMPCSMPRLPASQQRKPRTSSVHGSRSHTSAWRQPWWCRDECGVSCRACASRQTPSKAHCVS